MNSRKRFIRNILPIAFLIAALLVCCAAAAFAEDPSPAFSCEVYPLERNGISLHLDCMKLQETEPEKNILLIHGVTYSSHEFDINYGDYSLVRRLAREGYGVWRLDISGFGQSGEVADGFQADTACAAEDIHAAVEKIVQITGQDQIDLLGWSWGTMTVSRYAAVHSEEHIRKLVLYAPILSGIGAYEVTEDFHHNTWEHAASDFQLDDSGRYDESITDPVVIGLFCSGCWRFDGEKSPNGGRRDLCVAETERLIDLKALESPTLVICGDRDPYLNYDLVRTVEDDLPEGSRLVIIEGGSHVVYIERNTFRAFQEALLRFLAE